MFGMFPFLFNNSLMNNNNNNNGFNYGNILNNLLNDDFINGVVDNLVDDQEYDVSIKDYGPYYLIKGYLPGLTAKDINIDFDKNKAILTIKRKKTYSDGRNIKMTILQGGGDLVKTFYVEEIDVTKLQASFDNNLLLLTLPKKKQIEDKNNISEESTPTIIDVDNYKVE